MKIVSLKLALPTAILVMAFSGAGRAEESGSPGVSSQEVQTKIQYCSTTLPTAEIDRALVMSVRRASRHPSPHVSLPPKRNPDPLLSDGILVISPGCQSRL